MLPPPIKSMPFPPVAKPSFSAIVAASAVLFASSAFAGPVKSEPATRFIDSIGVNMHPYEDYQRHHEVLKKKLGELGVRHVRDGTTTKSFELAMSFFKTHGIKTTFITGRRVGGEKEWSSPRRPEGIVDELNDLRDQALQHDRHGLERSRGDKPAGPNATQCPEP